MSELFWLTATTNNSFTFPDAPGNAKSNVANWFAAFSLSKAPLKAIIGSVPPDKLLTKMEVDKLPLANAIILLIDPEPFKFAETVSVLLFVPTFNTAPVISRAP